MIQAGTRLRWFSGVIVGLALLSPIKPGHAAGAPPASVVVTNPVTLNPAAPNPVTIVNPALPPSTVTVGNSVATTDVTAASQPFQKTCHLNPFTAFANCDFEFTVPQGKTLVIEYVSYQLEYPEPDATLVFAAVQGIGGNDVANVPVPPMLNNVASEVGTNTSVVSTGAPTHILLRAGESLQMFFRSNHVDPAHTSLLQAFASGHLENNP
jgi:hypothetical protein